MSYSEEITTITNEVDGYTNWSWASAGTFTFQIIANDWLTSHKEKFLKHTEGRRQVCVQAGGCMGLYPRLLADYFGRVYTFEPDPLSFLCLAVNSQKDNIIKMQAALGEECKLVTIHRSVPENPGMNTINNTHGIIPMLTIDSLNLDGCDFMQLDVEFYELNILKGALKTIEKYKPVISCELGKLSTYDPDRTPGLIHNGKLLLEDTLQADMLDLLSPLGYEVVDRSLDDVIFKCKS